MTGEIIEALIDGVNIKLGEQFRVESGFKQFSSGDVIEIVEMEKDNSDTFVFVSNGAEESIKVDANEFVNEIDESLTRL